jgi:hypothetical protein
MAYSPTELNNPPNADPNYDAAAEPTPDNPNTYAPAVAEAEARAEASRDPHWKGRADPGAATSYNTRPQPVELPR